jgi:hypothetical protein
VTFEDHGVGLWSKKLVFEGLSLYVRGMVMWENRGYSNYPPFFVIADSFVVGSIKFVLFLGDLLLYEFIHLNKMSTTMASRVLWRNIPGVPTAPLDSPLFALQFLGRKTRRDVFSSLHFRPEGAAAQTLAPSLLQLSQFDPVTDLR